MFTGLIHSVAPVVRITPSSPGGARIVIDLGHTLAGRTACGDSISVSGACLTVAAKTGTLCEFDAVSETLSRTTLGRLRPGDRVNIEPSLRVGDPLGGHFVLGHVDGLGTVAALTAAGEGALLKITVDQPALTAHMVPKGSVAVDGVSLTLVDVAPAHFTCALIPTTLKDTTFGARRPGDHVNIETDILAKLVARSLGNTAPESSGLTLDRLREAGFA